MVQLDPDNEIAHAIHDDDLGGQPNEVLVGSTLGQNITVMYLMLFILVFCYFLQVTADLEFRSGLTFDQWMDQNLTSCLIDIPSRLRRLTLDFCTMSHFYTRTESADDDGSEEYEV